MELLFIDKENLEDGCFNNSNSDMRENFFSVPRALAYIFLLSTLKIHCSELSQNHDSSINPFILYKIVMRNIILPHQVIYLLTEFHQNLRT